MLAAEDAAIEQHLSPVRDRGAPILQRRRDLISREIKGIRQVFFALFTGPAAIKDRKLTEQIRRGALLHLSAEDLLSKKA